MYGEGWDGLSSVCATVYVKRGVASESCERRKEKYKNKKGKQETKEQAHQS